MRSGDKNRRLVDLTVPYLPKRHRGSSISPSPQSPPTATTKERVFRDRSEISVPSCWRRPLSFLLFTPSRKVALLLLLACVSSILFRLHEPTGHTSYCSPELFNFGSYPRRPFFSPARPITARSVNICTQP